MVLGSNWSSRLIFLTRVPSNVHFVVDDAAEEDWLYRPNSFDYIHTRCMLGAMEDFGDLVKKGFKYTKPGGWMESQVNEIFPLSIKRIAGLIACLGASKYDSL